MSMDELTEILAGGPISCLKKSRETKKVAVAKGEGNDRPDKKDVGSFFELNDWV